MAQFGASMVGTDTGKIVLWTQQMIESGSTDVIPSPFYSSAPLMVILAAIGSGIIGVTAPSGFLIYALLAGTMIPISTAAIVDRQWDDRGAALLAAALSVTVAPIVGMAIAPIPQNIAVLYWTGAIMSTSLYIRLPDRRLSLFLLVGAFVTGSLYSHKIAAFLLFVTFICTFTALFVKKIIIGSQNETTALKPTFNLAMLAGLILFVQWDYLVNYFDRAIARILAIRTSPQTAPEVEFTAAVALNGDVLSLISYSMQLLVGLSIAGICWWYLATTDYRRENTIYLLISTAVITSMVIASVFAPISNNRMLFYAAPLLVVIIGGAVALEITPRKTLILTIAILFIFTQLFAATATPDYHDSTRTYLTEPEADAKMWGENYSTRVYADARFAGENPRSNIVRQKEPSIHQPLGTGVLNGTISSDYKCIAYRERAQNSHSVTQGTYEWTWDMESELERTRNKVYTSKSVSQYC
ncbi:hypothetical protein [Halorubrum sp. Ea1]|uniref:hypothetical protein n=1 Tax=Halorubrum sp. Ea1 TaxID=1480718 RepID=UPI00114000D3|nr:hypothetical protein [Halorubrum sp. Ea1]